VLAQLTTWRCVGIVANMASRKIVGTKADFPEGTILEMVAWELDQPVPGSRHRYKYRFFFGVPGKRLIGYDNERGKGDHRHIGGSEEPFEFISLDQVILDFRRAVERWREANADTHDIGGTGPKEAER
jgi:hypothetical protein